MVSLKYKILLLTIVPLTLVLIVIGGLTIHNKVSTEKLLLLNRLEAYRSLLESGDLSFETSADKSKLESFFNEGVEFSEIINKNYNVLYNSENSVTPFFSEEERQDINDAFNGIETTKNIEAEQGKDAAFVIVSPLIVNGKVVAVLYQGLSNNKSNQRIITYSISIILLIFAGIAFCLLLVSILSNNLVLKYIYNLKQSAIEIRQGNLDKTIEARTKDEIGTLAETLDLMREAIKNQKKQLEESNKGLEQKVKERTVELESKNNELEKFNKVAVDRELRMIELKKKIKDLEEKKK